MKKGDKRTNHSHNYYPHQNNHSDINNSPNFSISNQYNQSQTLQEDIRQQLRQSLEQLQQYKLSSQLQEQKRALLEQQLKSYKMEIEDMKFENQQLSHQVSNLKKKYSKLRQKRKQCDKCKQILVVKEDLEREREAYMNDRGILKEQIKNLKSQLETNDLLNENQNLCILTETLRRQLQSSHKKIEQQSRMLNFMNERLSLYETQNLRIMSNLETLEDKMAEMEIRKVSRGFQEKRRKNGKIKNVVKKSEGELVQLESFD